MKILIPDTVPWLELPGVDVVRYDGRSPVADEHRDAEVVVVWGQRREHLLAELPRLPRLRLVQGLAAGIEPVAGLGLPDSVAVCSGAGLHGPMVGEHAVALVLALLRRLPTATQAQRDHRWAAESLGRPRPVHVPGRPTETLRDAHVVVWGFGDIGLTVARLVEPFGARVTGVARTAGERGGVRVVADVDVVLPEADVLVMAIPGGEETRHALDARRLALLPRGTAFVVNVGRGSSIDQAALEAALRDGSLAGAALDVTDPEPLPPDSTLWDAPNLLITPHSAGGRPLGVAELLAHQLAHLDDGALRNPVTR